MCFINSLNKNDTRSKSQPKINIWRDIDGSEVENQFFLTLLEVPEVKGQIYAISYDGGQTTKTFVEIKYCPFLTRQLIDTENKQITIQSDSYGVQMMILHRS